MDKLISYDLCTHAQKQALLNYHEGYVENETGGYVKKINHMKLVSQPGHPLFAKAYVYYNE